MYVTRSKYITVERARAALQTRDRPISRRGALSRLIGDYGGIIANE